MELIDRHAERSLLDGALRDVRLGQSRVLVLHGDPGIGKSALLDYVAGQANGCRLIRVAGVESEMELAYAALHQMCMPMLDGLHHLPPPQRKALATAFGLSAGPAPDRFLVGLAVLNLFSDAAEQQPLLCLIDDLQWLDRTSAQAISFVGRRLGAESVGLIVATRVTNCEMATLPAMHVRGLPTRAARTLLDAVLTTPLDERIRDRVVAETGGNPLALLEWPHGLSVRELAGGFGLPGAPPLAAAVEDSFRREVQSVPEQTRRLLLLAAAEPLGDPGLLWRAAEQLGIDTDAARPAVEAELAEFGFRVRFRHPLVRSVVYRTAAVEERQSVHRALANVTDPTLDAERRAWHRAQATETPDEDVAAELERSAARAQARGGPAAAAAFLKRATMLTLDPSRRADRALAAASAKVQAGVLDAARDMLAVAEAEPLTDCQSARADLLRARLAYVTGGAGDAATLLLKAAKRLEPIDAALSRETYLDALDAAWTAGPSSQGDGVSAVARVARSAPKPQTPRHSDFLLDGFVAICADGYPAGLPVLRHAVNVACDASPDEELHWLVGIAAVYIWDDESWDVLTARHLAHARTAGATAELQLALSSRATMLLFAGELTAAEALICEGQSVMKATGEHFATGSALRLAAFRGDQPPAATSIKGSAGDGRWCGGGRRLSSAAAADALRNNGAGAYGAASDAALDAVLDGDLVLSAWGAVELVEAAAHNSKPHTATSTLCQLGEMTTASGTDWALGVEARSRALVSDGVDAERLYREAVERLGRTRIRTDLARAHLLYGEWLRRERRRTDARTQLRIALGMFEAMGMEGFAVRTRRELLATGETARKRTVAAASSQLTPQEAEIARLAGEGLTNPEIGARLFISAKTVQYHLSKVFTKLGINSRSQLPDLTAGNRGF